MTLVTLQITTTLSNIDINNSSRKLSLVIRGPFPVRILSTEGMTRLGVFISLSTSSIVVALHTWPLAVALLVPSRTEIEVHSGRDSETEGPADALQINLLHVENVLQAVRRVAQ